MRKLHMDLTNGYDIYIGKDLLKDVDKYFNLNRKVLIISDDGVPEKYIKVVQDKCKSFKVVTFEQGEKSKNLDTYKMCIDAAIDFKMDRKDAVVAIGGGVVGDLAGFVASSYMRGIDFYNIATTTLSQIDSSIGGKVAVDHYGYKNIIGAFYQPKGVLIDLDTLKTLDQRNINNGLAEAIKAGLIGDKELFEMFEKEEEINLEEVIYHSLCLKKKVVEEDEKEQGLRKILNFGHTIGHGMETYNEGKYIHGECVAMGMMKIIEDKEIKERLKKVLNKFNLPYDCSYDTDKLIEIIKHDKKARGDKIDIVVLNEIGEAKIQSVDYKYLEDLLNGWYLWK